MAEVASGTKISSSFLSLIENGKSDITMGRLIRLVSYFGVSITELMPDGLGPAGPLIVRQGEQKIVQSASEGINLHLLAPDTRRLMMPFISVYEPGAELADYVSHEGEEFLHVLRGKIELHLRGSDPVILSPGDSAYFPGNRPHRTRNAWKSQARLFRVVTPPTL